MSKILKYTTMTDGNSFGKEFDFVVQDEKVLEAITEFVFENYFGKKCLKEYESIIKKSIKEFLEELETYDELVDAYTERLEEYFYADAMNNARDLL